MYVVRIMQPGRLPDVRYVPSYVAEHSPDSKCVPEDITMLLVYVDADVVGAQGGWSFYYFCRRKIPLGSSK